MRFHRPLCLSTVAFTLAACGGGGGGDGGGGSGGAVPAPPSAQFALTDANAVDALKTVFGSIDEIRATNELVLLSAQTLTGRTTATISCEADPVGTIEVTNTDPDGNRAPSAGDVLTWRQPACGRGARRISFTVTTATTLGIRGHVEFDAEIAGPTLTRVQGNFEVFQLFIPQYAWHVTAAHVVVTSGGVTETFDMRSVARADEPSTGYAISLEGSVESSKLGGRFDFATASPLRGILGSFPVFGEVVLTTAGSRLRVSQTANTNIGREYADYQVAAGAQAYPPARQARWAELLVGGLFGHVVPQPPQPPLIARVAFSPPDPTAESFVWARVTAYDANNEPLRYTFEWRRNGILIPGAIGEVLPAGQHKRDDIIEVTVRVSDGRQTAALSAATRVPNASPRIAATAIAPSAPNADNPLTLTATITDADSDPLQVSYQWRRNGTVIPGATTSTLPPNGHRPNDVITGTITVSDGRETVVADTSVAVLDRPVQVTVVSAPVTVDHGDLVTFAARAQDPDGDSVDHLRFVLNHGPAGMTVNPVSGVVSWSADPPMFDRSMEFSWEVAVDDASATPVSGRVTVQDNGRSYAMMRTSLASPLLGAMTVADFDSDGDTEALILSLRGLYELESDGSGGYRQSWMYPYALAKPRDTWPDLNGNTTAMTAGDIDGDGKHEIFLAAEGLLARLDGVERRVVDTVDVFDSEKGCGQLRLADVDRNGEIDLVCLVRDGELVLLSANDLSVRWRFPPANHGYSFDVANVDSDAALEIVTSAGYVYDGVSLANQRPNLTYFGLFFDVADLTGDGIAEIVANDGASLRAFNAAVQAPLWELPVSYTPMLMLVHRASPDPTPNIVVGTTYSLLVYEYEPQTKRLTLVTESSNYGGASAVAVADVDGDGQLELLGNSGSFDSGPDQLVVSRFDPSLTVEWMTSERDDFDGPFVGGEVVRAPLTEATPLFGVYSTGSGFHGARLLLMDADDGDLKGSSDVGSAGGLAMTVSDFDKDGADEAFIVTGDHRGAYASAYDVLQDRAEWTSPLINDYPTYSSIAKADLSGDSRDELLTVTGSGDVRIYNVFGNAVLWQTAMQGVGKEISAADLDGDGVQEIIVATSQRLSVYARVVGPATYAEAATVVAGTGLEIADVAIADTDGDGAKEVVLLQVASNPFTQNSFVQRLDKQLRPLGTFSLPWRSTLIGIEPSTSPRKNLLVPTGDTNFRERPSQLVAVDARSGREIWRSPFLLGEISRNSVQYVQIGSGPPRISVGTLAGMYVTQ